MNSVQRRQQIAAVLQKSDDPVSAAVFARKFQVSRQIIVGDIALLRAAGTDITATPRGYILDSAKEGLKIVQKIACKHNPEETKKELYTIVDLGGSVLDVIVEHPIYGQLCGELHIHSRFDVDNFIKKTQDQNALLLSKLTGGAHLHTISCKDRETFDRILKDLRKEGLLFDTND